MKQIWFIDEDKLELKTGYVNNNYQFYGHDESENDLMVLVLVDKKSRICALVSREYLFENKETAINMYKGMIGIERVKVYNKIEELKKYDESLFEKLLNI